MLLERLEYQGARVSRRSQPSHCLQVPREDASKGLFDRTVIDAFVAYLDERHGPKQQEVSSIDWAEAIRYKPVGRAQLAKWMHHEGARVFCPRSGWMSRAGRTPGPPRSREEVPGFFLWR